MIASEQTAGWRVDAHACLPSDVVSIYLPRLSRISGLDLRAYRPQFLERRLALAVQRAGASALPSYLQSLERAGDAAARLRQALTVDVSRFFRDPHDLDTLSRLYLPLLLAQTPRLRIWSAGCASGAELYSLAMTLALVVGEANLGRHELRGTDINERGLESARRGTYGPRDVAQVPPELLVHFFQPAAGDFALNPVLRAAATFEQHDLLRGPMRGGWQLIACRNVAIYLEAPVQSLLYQRLSAALAVGGLLWLGSAEYLPQYASLHLERLAPHLYRRLPAVSS